MTEKKKESEYLLEVKDLHVQYNTDDAIVYAVNGLNLSLKRGEKLGLVGETGAGKTTLALSILQLLPKRVGQIASGSIKYQGEELL
ncbi:MAG: ATP-binding cassette domain-containing protein, partial [Sphaerochaetaceae bacterium]|nr:ATP-binding cassette domain-containing protein [Sphaerochaetaceae bacterium]